MIRFLNVNLVKRFGMRQHDGFMIVWVYRLRQDIFFWCFFFGGFEEKKGMHSTE